MPGNFGCGSAVLAAITMLAPSLAAFKAIALPIPLLAPVIKMVRPASFLKDPFSYITNAKKMYQIALSAYPVLSILMSCCVSVENQTANEDIPDLLTIDYSEVTGCVLFPKQRIVDGFRQVS